MAEVSHGELEAQVLDVLWSADAAMTPGEVQTALAARRRSLAYTTVMTVLTRLWNKGIVDRKPAGRAFAYRPVLSREDTVAQHMSELLDAADDQALALSRFVETIGPKEKAQLRRLLTPRKRR